MNAIIEDINAKKFNYCHAVEVMDLYELESIVETLTEEFRESYEIKEIKDFFSSMSIYSLNEENEDEIYNFNIEGYIDELI
tara:strand:- start:402 stop:644 length:243 start_codon:yes stop_codon:yes gene_type:complete